MDLLADENQHPLVSEMLRAAGLVVEAVAETSPGVSDEAILERPDIGSLVLLTYDRDFGDLIFNRGYSTPRAILYTRLSRIEPEAIGRRLRDVLATGPADGHMTVITRDGTRPRPFPSGDRNG